MNKKDIMVAIYSIVGIILICSCTQTSKNTTDSQKESEHSRLDAADVPPKGYVGGIFRPKVGRVS